MKAVKILLALALCTLIIAAQTSRTYFENFNSNNEVGWAFTSADGQVATIDGVMTFASENDELVHIFPPIGATKDDFHMEVKGYGNTAGGFGRVGFYSFAGIFIDDSIYIVYSDNLQTYDDSDLKWLGSYPIPDDFETFALSLTRSGTTLQAKAYVNKELAINSEIQNADEDLFTGQAVAYLIKEDSPIEFNLDEIEIKYNPYITSGNNYLEEFDTSSIPWFKFGDFSAAGQAIQIYDGNLNFNYYGTSETALFVMPATPAVKDFSIIIEGGGNDNHNAPFSISRFFDYKNYVTLFIEDNELNVGYADNNYEPTVLASVPYTPTEIDKIIFSVQEFLDDLTLNVTVNDQSLITTTINNASEKIKAGRLIFGYDRGNIVDAYLSYSEIGFDEYLDPAPNTSRTFFENFNSESSRYGWGFTAYDAIVSINNSQLYLQSNNDDLIQIITPIDATEGDFSFEVKPGMYMSGQEGGGFGRASMNGLIAMQYSDYFNPGYIDIIYTNDIQDYVDPNFTVLGSIEAPDEIASLKLDVIESENNLLVMAYLDNELVFSGEIENADEGLKKGKMYLTLDPLDEDGLTEWSMDEVTIKYNPYIQSSNNFVEDFNDAKVPWHRFGDLDNIVQSVFINDGKLNFNYNNSEEGNFYVFSPVGAVKDFSIEMEGWGSDQHEAPFGISRVFDYKNYITFFIEDNQLSIGYAVDSWEPTVLNSMEFNPTNIAKIKFTVETVGDDLLASISVNDQYSFASTITNPPDIIRSGHIAFGYDRGKVMDAYIDYVNIDFTQFVTEVEDDISINVISDYHLYQNYPNPFNPTTTITFNLPCSEYTNLKVFDILGKEVATLINGELNKGLHSINWNASNLTSGIYIYSLSVSGKVISNKMLLLK